MSVLGTVSGWGDFFPSQLIEDVLRLLTSCWDEFPKPERTDLEVPITRRFREALIKDKDRRRLPFSIWPESSETDPDTGIEIGRIDLRFLHGYREQVYLAFECKRLRIFRKGKVLSNVGEYVGNEGMMRHITGKYSSGLQDAGMIGYVMDGDCSAAKRSICRSIKQHASTLHADENEPLAQCSFRSQDPRLAQSRHALARGPLKIYHVLLGV